MGKSAVKGLLYTCLVTATLLLSAVIVTAAFAGRVSPTASTLMPLLGLVLPVLQVIDLIIASCWMFARKVWG